MSNSKYQSDWDREQLKVLGVLLEDKIQAEHAPVQERVLGGFETIDRFVEEHERLPDASEDRSIFERLYAVRLECLRRSDEYKELLVPKDRFGLLAGECQETLERIRGMSEEEMLKELGVERTSTDITELKHVRSYEERKAAEEIANRQPCADFEQFKHLFPQVEHDIRTGIRERRKFELKSEIEQGRFFVIGGQLAYVESKGEVFLTEHKRTDARLRVIFDNGTESGMLMRSLQRALHKDPDGQRVTDRRAGSMFSDKVEEGDRPGGTIYVLRSKSDLPYVVENREFVHKIGVTHTDIHKRVANAHLQPTFLMAGVEVVATYDLYNINGKTLERLIHLIFGDAQLDIEVKDRFGRPVRPQEWFFVPRPVIDEAVEKIKEGTIGQYAYDRDSMTLRPREDAKD